MRNFYTLIIFISCVQLNAQSFSTFINELNYTASNPTERGLEVVGEAGASMDGWSVVYYSVAGLVSEVEALSGNLSNEQGGYGIGWYEVDQSGDKGGIALVNPTGFVTQFVSYGIANPIQAIEGAANGMSSEYIGTQLLPENSLQLTGQGVDYSDFIWNLPQGSTKGQVNTSQIFSLIFRNQTNTQNATHALSLRSDFVEFKAFPNPVINELSVQFLQPSEENTSIQLINANGQIIDYKVVSQGDLSTEFDFSNLESGKYIVLLTNESYQKSKIIIKP